MTANCEPAERVTCFVITGKDEEVTTVKVDGEKYRGNVKDMRIEKTKQEPEHHKGFYFLEDSSGESSESGKPKDNESSNQDEIIINGRTFSSNTGHSEEGIYVNAKSKFSNHKEEISEKFDDSKDLLNLSEKPLDQQSEIKKVDESDPIISVDFHGPTEPELIKGDYATKEIEDHEPHAGEDLADGYKDLKERLKKREDIVKDAIPKSNETQKEENPEDGLDKVEDEKSRSISDDEELNIAGPSTSLSNNVTYQITNIRGTNVLTFGLSSEPIANWTEHIDNGWTDLLIYWKHPVDEDFQGSVFFKYPSNSMSDQLEIKDLVLEILQIANRPEESASDETMAEDYPEVDNPQETSVKGTQTE